MSWDDAYQAAFLIIFGAWLAIHCSRASQREIRSGTAQGLRAPVSRRSSPVHFWTIILGNCLAAAMGAAFLAWGTVLLVTSPW